MYGIILNLNDNNKNKINILVYNKINENKIKDK